MKVRWYCNLVVKLLHHSTIAFALMNFDTERFEYCVRIHVDLNIAQLPTVLKYVSEAQQYGPISEM